MTNFLTRVRLQPHIGFMGLLLLFSATAPQQLRAGDTPLKTVQQFKQLLDEGNLADLCTLMAENDGSEPLKRAHYEQMQQSLDGLVKLWQGVGFSYGETETNTSEEPNRAFVKVRVYRPNQEIRFTLLKFGANWYIVDIEISFK